MPRPSTHLLPADAQAPAGPGALRHEVDGGRATAGSLVGGRESRTPAPEGAADPAAEPWRSLA